MDQESEQNKTEQPTPFKLKRARERGVVARGIDLGYFASLTALAAFALIAGDALMRGLAMATRHTLIASGHASYDIRAIFGVWSIYGDVIRTVALLSLTIIVVVTVFEIIQLRGIVFSTKPLKPDFSRLNPAKGLKRFFSMRLLKEAAKNVVKLCLYGATAAWTIYYALQADAMNLARGGGVVEAFRAHGFRLLFAFAGLALFFAIIDQVISRGEFTKQMRMSRRELTREHKEREGEPRLKQKRKQMHADFAKQARALGDLRGSDMLIVNPQHYAVALAYDPHRMSAPKVIAKGRNHFALLLRRKAERQSLAIFERPQLARALYRLCDKGQEIPHTEYPAVVELYLKLRRSEEPAHAMD